MSVKDPYELLGVDRSATVEDVKAAFKKLAAKHHPDKNPDDPEASQRFKEINAAYQLLSDPKKREMFDRFGAGPSGFGSASSGPFGGMPFDFSEVQFDGIFGDLLSALGIKTAQNAVLQKELKIKFEEAAFGCVKELTYERAEPCTDCNGSGAEPGTSVTTCGVCRGRGRVRMQQGVFPIPMDRPCNQCKGAGKTITHPCGTCRGAGVVVKARTIEVTIPAGTENGATRLVERGGNYTRADRPAGDLELVVRVTPHEVFRRLGDDVACALSISYPLAALGGDIEVPTLDGRGKLRIPAGTQPGTILRIKGKGIPRRVTSSRGDQLVEVTVSVPQRLTDQQRALLVSLGESLGQAIQPVVAEPSLIDRIKAFFGGQSSS